jgi:hypothetical protein
VRTYRKYKSQPILITLTPTTGVLNGIALSVLVLVVRRRLIETAEEQRIGEEGAYSQETLC